MSIVPLTLTVLLALGALWESRDHA